jgi:RimJ/RimL family protein N-acetyltransferase
MIDYRYGVSLDRIDPDDDLMVTQLYEWRNDPRIFKWCRQRTVLHWHDHLKWIGNQSTDPRMSMFVVKVKQSVVGVCGFTDIDYINRRAEFSLYIAPCYQRKGFARAALMTLFRHGFEDFSFKTIWGETFQGNPAFNLFVDIGMTPEGTRRNFYYKEGAWIDVNLLSIIKSEFSSTMVKWEGAYVDGDNHS